MNQNRVARFIGDQGASIPGGNGAEGEVSAESDAYPGVAEPAGWRTVTGGNRLGKAESGNVCSARVVAAGY